MERILGENRRWGIEKWGIKLAAYRDESSTTFLSTEVSSYRFLVTGGMNALKKKHCELVLFFSSFQAIPFAIKKGRIKVLSPTQSSQFHLQPAVPRICNEHTSISFWSATGTSKHTP